MNVDTPRKTRVLVVEDQGMVRGFFERWISSQLRFEVVAALRTGEEAIARVGELRPDLALVDFQLPGMDGLEFIRAARQVRPQLRALVVSSLVDPLALTRIRESGVEGFIEKDASPDLLIQALECVADGRSYHSAKFREVITREGTRAESVGKILSKREQQVLMLVLAKKQNRDIATHMGLSVRTVEFHRHNMMSKLGATNLTELVEVSRQRGIV